MEDLKTQLEARARAYRAVLQAEGYGAAEPEWRDAARTWTLRLRYEGMHLFFIFDQDDPDFVRLVMPSFLSVPAGRMVDVLIAVDQTNKSCKAAKVYVDRDDEDVMAAVEFLDAGGEPSFRILGRYLAMTLNAARHAARLIVKHEEVGAGA